MSYKHFIKELRRRHVFRVAVAYAVTAWLLLQLAAIVLPTFGAPHWVLKVLIGVFVLFFPLALLLAWAFESTPDGVRRTVPADAEHAQPAAQRRRLGQLLNRVIIVVLAAAVGILLWRLFGTITKPQAARINAAATTRLAATAPGTAIPAKSIAVLPFENLSADKTNQYFTEGIQDLILTKLADIGGLAVISRTSTMRYGSRPENLVNVGQQLGVATILEGSVQKVGDQVLINVQLIDAHTDQHIWAQSYQRTLKNVFGVEGEVAEKIASTLKTKLSPMEARDFLTVLSNNPAANDLYLRGQYFANRVPINSDWAEWKHAIAYYRQAIAKAPDFALARARLSIAESSLAWQGGEGESVPQLYADARVQAEQALKLAPNLADAHLAMGYYEYWSKGNYAAALKAFTAAIALRPSDSDALVSKAFILRRQGKFDEAINEFKTAFALDPRDTNLAFHIGATYMMVAKYAEAEQTLQHALALDPTNVQARAYYAFSIVFRSGNLSRALAQMQGDNTWLKLRRLSLLTWARKYAQALTLLQSIPDRPHTFTPPGGPKSLQLAYLYELRGDSAKANALYAKALPLTRAQYAALSGSPAITRAFALTDVAQAEIGLGRIRTGMADTARVQAIAERSTDYIFGPLLMRFCAQLYARAGRARKAVTVLSAAMTTPGFGTYYSPTMLWIDPAWDPIRKIPEFQALLKKYAKYGPAKVSEASDG